MEGDTAYFGRRATEEREAASQARSPEARKAHLELAQRYDDLVNGMTSYHERLGLDSDGELR